jgi:hypothetical protein
MQALGIVIGGIKNGAGTVHTITAGNVDITFPVQ